MFALFHQMTIEASQNRVALDGTERRHEQGGANCRSPTLDATLAFQRATISVNRGEARQSSDLFVGQCAKLWQVG